MAFTDCKYLDKQHGFDIYIPKEIVFHENIEEKFRILHFGQRNNLPTKTMLLIGETGSGKTTMLMAIYNNFRGVDLEDNYRWKLFEEEEGCKGKEAYDSQTEFITAYLFYAQPCMKHKEYNIMAIDTPGLCDTRGTEKQKSVMEQITEFLRKEDYGIDDLSCIGYVVKASLTRDLEYVKESIQESLTLFGTDTNAINFILKTFAFRSDNCIKDILKKWGIDTQNEFDFDNGVLFKPNKVGVANKQGKPTTKKDMDVAKLMWEDMSESYAGLFQRLSEVTPVSLRLTKKAMEQKVYLEEKKTLLTEQVISVVKNLALGSKNQRMLEGFRKSMEENKDWEGEEVVREKKYNPVEDVAQLYMIEPHVHNCVECERSCSSICHLFRHCPSMLPKCFCCGCLKSKHIRAKYYIEEVIKVKKVTKEDMKTRFLDAENNKDKLEKYIAEMDEDTKKMKKKIATMIKILELLTEKLNKICRGKYDQSAEDLTQELINKIKNNQEFLNFMGDEGISFLISLEEEIKVTKVSRDNLKADLEKTIQEFSESTSKKLKTN